MTVEKYQYEKPIPDGFEDISEANDFGILKKIIKSGPESAHNPCRKDKVFVSYVGTNWGGPKDGEQFDSSNDFNFVLGVGDVIKSWDVCVATMKPGEICELISSPSNAYNDGKVLHFKIEFFRSEGEDVSTLKDGSITKSIVQEGEGIANPAYGVDATISYKSLNKANADEVKKTYLVGDPSAQSVPDGIDQAVRAMTYNETAHVRIKSHETGDNSSELFEVKLLSFEKIKRLASLENFDKQMEYADTIKDRANNHLKGGKYHLAIELYKRLSSEMQYLIYDGPAEKKRLDEMQMAVFNNCALAYLKSGKHDECIEQCGKSLELDLKNEKALFRKAQAYLAMKDHEEALRFFNNCLHYHPNNIDALKMKKFCQDEINKAKSTEKARFRGIFNRLKDTGLGLPDEPAPMETDEDKEHGSCDSCDGSEAEMSETEKA